MSIIFAIWGLGIFLRYLADFGDATAITGAMIVIFRNHLLSIPIILFFGSLLLFAIDKLNLVARARRIRNVPPWVKFATLGGLALVPFVFWPAVQLINGVPPIKVAPGLGAALAIIFIAAAALAGGLKLAKWIRHKPDSLLEQGVVGMSLGFGALMLASFIMGIAHLYYRPLAYALVIGTICFGWRDMKEFFAACRMRARVHTRTPKRFSIVLVVALILAIFATLLSAGIFVQYPVGYDAMISYLTYPQEYVQAHEMVAFPFWVYWGFPQNAEMLFTLGWLLWDFRVAAGIIFCFTLLIGGAMLLFLKNARNITKTIALLIFYTLPIIAFQNFVEQKAEIIFAFYVLLSYAFVLKYARERQYSALLLCGIFSGIAAGLKYFFFPWYAIPIVLLLLWIAFKDRSQVKALFVWSFIAIALFAPWAARNLVVSGKALDPISVPFTDLDRQTFFSQMGLEGVDFVVTEMRNEAYLLWDDHENKNLSYLLRTPFSLTFMGNKKYLSDGLRLGPLLLMFLPLVLIALARRKGRLDTTELKFVTLSLPLLVIGWIFLGHLATWYAIPTYVLFAILAAWIIEENSGRRVRLVAILAICAWTAIFISGQYHRRFTYGPLYVAGNEMRANLWQISDWMNRELPSEAKIWGIGEPRGFYVDRSFERYIPDNYHLAFSWLLRDRGPAGTIQFLDENNIKYLLIHGGYGDPGAPNVISYAYLPNGSQRYAELIWNINKELIDFKDQYLELIHSDGSYFLYKVKTPAGAL